ncbi:MAG: MFS transporter [Thermaerobacter sp.]|nr:MFS transporter [Thermaerobacter sp.]
MSGRRRWWVLAALSAGFFLNFLDRGAISVAAPFLGRDLHLDKLQLGEVMSAFFLGFVLLQFPAGMVADRLGPRLVAAAGMVWWSVFTAVTGLATGFGQLFSVRFLFGLGEGLYPPSSLKALAQWFPHRERATANGLMLSADRAGFAVAPLVGVLVIAAWGWRPLFWLLGLPGLVAAAWIYWTQRGMPAPPRRDWRWRDVGRLLALPAVWYLAAMWFFFYLAFWGISSWLPTYLYRDLHATVFKMGVGASIPFAAAVLGMLLGGVLSDRWAAGRRKRTIVPALVLAAACLTAGVLAHSLWLTVGLFALGMFCHATVSSGFYAAPADLLPPQVVGGALGLVNALGMLSGVVAPTLFGWVVQRTGSYADGFWPLVASLGVAAILMGIVPEGRAIRGLSWPVLVPDGFGGQVAWPELPAGYLLRRRPQDAGLPADGCVPDRLAPGPARWPHWPEDGPQDRGGGEG